MNHPTIEQLRNGVKSGRLPTDGNPTPGPPEEAPQQPVRTEYTPLFEKELFDLMPEYIKHAHNQVLQTPKERDVFLLGCLSAISGLLPNVVGHYGDKYVKPNLFVYVIGPAGSGKGILSHVERIFAPISEMLASEYQSRKEEYRSAKAQQNKGEDVDLPPVPVSERIKLPADTSKAAFIGLLENNGARGVMFETEGDTLANAFGKEYGAFSDMLRKAFHNEVISTNTKTDGYKDISSPGFSVLISSTMGQFFRIINSPEDGLFSRFIYVSLDADREFINPFNVKRRDYPEYFNHMGTKFLKLYRLLDGLTDQKIEVKVTPGQEKKFMDYFPYKKNDVWENLGPQMDATVNRSGLICFKLVMVFTVLRNLIGKDYLVSSLVCHDNDFEASIEIAKKILNNALDIHSRLPRPELTKEHNEVELELITKADKIAEAKKLAKQGYDCRTIGKGLGVPKSTIYRWISSNK